MAYNLVCIREKITFMAAQCPSILSGELFMILMKTRLVSKLDFALPNNSRITKTERFEVEDRSYLALIVDTIRKRQASDYLARDW